MTKQTNKALSFLSIITLVLALNGCGGGGGGNDGATPTSSTQESAIESETYTFENTTDSLNIESYRPYEISFQLTQGGLAQAGKAVSMETFDKTYGTITNYNIVTDDNGVGTFTYNPPKIMPDFNTTHTIEYKYIADANMSNIITKSVKLNFNYNIISENEKTTALSLVYMETISEAGSGKIINRYRVHAVDKKSNQPRIGIPVTMSLINNAKVIQLNNLGSIDKNDTLVTFIDTTKNFSEVEKEDNLIILPTENRLDASYLGGWSVEERQTNTKLKLFESDTNLTTTDKLSYIIGDEVRLVGDKISVADVVNLNNDTTTDEDGYIIFDVTFDPKLAGHTVTLEAHGDVDGQRVGVSQIVGLRIDDINAKSYTIDDVIDVDQIITLTAIINGTESLSNIKTIPNTFHTATSDSSTTCNINESKSNYITDNYGNIKLFVETIGLGTGSDHIRTSCTISWDGGMESLYREY